MVTEPLGIEGRRTDRVLHHRVGLEQVEPGLSVPRFDGSHRGPTESRAVVTAHLGHHVVGVATEVVHLGLQRLGVRTFGVGPPEAHDDVGDALLLETVDAVDE